jgi:hypothetical protein
MKNIQSNLNPEVAKKLSLFESKCISLESLKDLVLASWKAILKSKIGNYTIGKEIIPSPQITSFFLHELIAHELASQFNKNFAVPSEKYHKDVVCIKPSIDYSFEIKASSDKSKVFGNRSYAQSSADGSKNKDGYLLTVNFEKFAETNMAPKIRIIRFVYIVHSDWHAQKSAKGQQASLSPDVYKTKMKTIYTANESDV